MNLWKSKQEREIERQIKAKEGKKAVERHIRRQKTNVEKYWELAKRAYRLRDSKRFEQISTLVLATQRDVQQWEQRLLDFDMIEAQRDQVLAAADFARSYEAMAKSMISASDPVKLANIQRDIQVALMRAEMMDTVLENFSEMSQEMLQETALNDRGGEIKAIMASLKAEAEQEAQAPDDRELEANLRAIEEQLKGR